MIRRVSALEELTPARQRISQPPAYAVDECAQCYEDQSLVEIIRIEGGLEHGSSAEHGPTKRAQ